MYTDRGQRKQSITQTNLWLRHMADTLGAPPNATVAELSSLWRALPWPRREEIWRAWTKPSGDPDDVVHGTYWDWNRLAWGLYYRQDDDDISTTVTSTERREKWLSADGVAVHTKESSWVPSCVVM